MTTGRCEIELAWAHPRAPQKETPTPQPSPRPCAAMMPTTSRVFRAPAPWSPSNLTSSNCSSHSWLALMNNAPAKQVKHQHQDMYNVSTVAFKSHKGTCFMPRNAWESSLTDNRFWARGVRLAYCARHHSCQICSDGIWRHFMTLK